MPIEAVDPPTDTKPKADKPPRRRAPNSAKLEEGLTELYVTLGTIAVAPFDKLAGTLLVAQAPELAAHWVALAETNPAVKKALLKLVEAGGWGGLIVAHGMVVMPVLANRGAFPDHVANGAAMMTVMQHPETADLFTHARFKEPLQQNATENGDGLSP